MYATGRRKACYRLDQMRNPFKSGNKQMNNEPQSDELEQPDDSSAVVDENSTGAEIRDIGDGSVAANQKLLRLQADFENFRRRNASAKQEARDESRREMLEALLPIYDNFLRAIEHAEEAEDYSPFFEGVRGIRQQFDEFFRRQGLVSILAEPGDVFDPHLHEATGALPGSPEQDQTIAKELQKGFTHKDQVVRTAKVLVYTA